MNRFTILGFALLSLFLAGCGSSETFRKEALGTGSPTLLEPKVFAAE